MNLDEIMFDSGGYLYSGYKNKRGQLLTCYENLSENEGIEYTVYSKDGYVLDGGVMEYPKDDDRFLGYKLKDFFEFVDFEFDENATQFSGDKAWELVEILNEIESAAMKLQLFLGKDGVE